MTHEECDSIAALDALGVAGAADAGALRLHLAGCIPCRRARIDYGEAAALIARSLEPVLPPRFLRERIIDGVQGEERRNTAWWLGIAASLFLVLWGWREAGLRNASVRESAQRAQIEQLQREKATLEQRTEKLTSEITALSSTGTRTIALSGQEIAPAASARVFLEPDRR